MQVPGQGVALAAALRVDAVGKLQFLAVGHCLEDFLGLGRHALHAFFHDVLRGLVDGVDMLHVIGMDFAGRLFGCRRGFGHVGFRRCRQRSVVARAFLNFRGDESLEALDHHLEVGDLLRFVVAVFLFAHFAHKQALDGLQGFNRHRRVPRLA